MTTAQLTPLATPPSYPSDTQWAKLSDWTKAGRIARNEETS